MTLAGSRGVATGGAEHAASRAERNPWELGVEIISALKGQRNRFLSCCHGVAMMS
jgi:hypothetical protein